MENIIFVVDGFKLQAQAHLLLSSYLMHMEGRAKLIAYVNRAETFPASLEKLFELANVERRYLPDHPEAYWRDPYPIGNKIIAAADCRPGEVTAFLDTDVLFCKPVEFAKELGDSLVAAVLSDYETSLKNSRDWQQVFDFYGLQMPPERPGTLRRRRLDYPPYFNGGVIIFKEGQIGASPLTIGQKWLQMSQEMERDFPIESRVNIDQITLSALGTAFGKHTQMLPQRLNFNIMASRPDPSYTIDIAHYHVFGRIWRVPHIGVPLLKAMSRFLGAELFAAFVDHYLPIIQWRKANDMRKAARRGQVQS